MRLAACSCGWELRVVVDGGLELRAAMPVMVDHWRSGHRVRATRMVRRSFLSAATHYAMETGRGVPRAQYEEAARAAISRKKRVSQRAW